jgi:methylthioribulose-1-phosphate dehydratase
VRTTAVPPVPSLDSNSASAFSLEGDSGRPIGDRNGPGPTEGAHGAGPSEGEEGRLREELCEAMAAIHQRGWCDGTGGNFSCVLKREPLQLLMAPSGVDKGRVQPQQLIVVGCDSQVRRGSGRASAETLLHLAIVKETGAGAVLHTHSQAGTLLSQWSWEWAARSPLGAGTVKPDAEAKVERDGSRELERRASSRPLQAEAVGFEVAGGDDGVAYLEVRNLEMLKGIAGINTHQSEVRIPVLANDQNLAQLSRRAAPHLGRAPAGLLIAGHGLYAWGQELSEARRHLEILEFLLEQRWRQLLLEALVERGLGSSSSQPGAGALRR